MSAESVQKLLNLPSDVRQPHAYQVFGLTVGEQDLDVIRVAVQSTIERLRSVRAVTDPAVWSQAASVVQQARSVLADPVQKAELDARFGIIAIGDDESAEDEFDEVAFESPTPKAADDPLAGLLPSANPLAPAAAPVQAPVAPPQPVLTEAPPQPSGFTAPKLKTKSPLPRRRRSMLPSLLMGTVVIGLTASVVGLTYFLVFGPGQVAVNSRDGVLNISTSRPNQVDAIEQASPPGPTQGADAVRIRDRDPIMGTLGPATPQSSNDSLGGDLAMPSANQTPTPTPGDDSPLMDNAAMPSVSPNPDTAPMVDAPPMVETPPMAEAPPRAEAPPMTPEPTAEAIEAGKAAILQAKAAIRSADWSQMKSIAEKASELAADDTQRLTAEGLFQLADLATFYKVGIDQAIAGLQIGSTFEVVTGIEANVVESGPDKLIIKVNGSNKRYTFATIPLVVAHKLATFHVSPDDATGVAAKAAFQAVAPISMPQHREQSIQWLSEIEDEIAGAEADKVIEAIRFVFDV